MVALAEKVVPVRKYTDQWIKCTSCQRGSNFVIEIKKDGDENYYYGEKCPSCNHYEEFRIVTKKEATKYLLLEDIS